MYSSRGPLHPPPGSGQRRAWWCGAENVPAILELFQSFHLHSCSTILLLGPSIFFSQGLTCSNLKGLMLTAKQPEIRAPRSNLLKCVCVCVSTPVSKDTTLAISIPMTFQTLYSSRGHGGRSPSRANKAMVFGWKRYWTQYLVPAILILTR